MASILSMNLASDDEDSDYSMSGASSEDEKETKKSKRQLKKEQELEKERQRLKEKVDAMFEDMLTESDAFNNHKQTVKDSDFMIQFHKKDRSPPERKNRYKHELEQFMSVSGSTIFDSAPAFSIRDFKEKCRNTPDSDKLEMIQKAVSTGDQLGPATSVKTYTFAGKTYTVKEQIDRTSKKYKQYLKKQQNNIGGAFAFLDDMASQLDAAPKISAIKKSEADWNQYKEEKRIDTLGKDHKFIKEQDFLYRTSWKEHDKYLHARNQ